MPNNSEFPTIEKFPADRLPAAREALADAHRKLARAAARAGQDAPAAPELAVLETTTRVLCTECGKASAPLFARGTLIPPPAAGEACQDRDCPGVFAVRTYVDLEIRGPRPRLDGWEFLAVVEPLTGGNLIRQVPGAMLPEGFTFDAWRAGALVCDHCHTSRRRLETFLVRGLEDGPAPGEVRQVGRNCLASFLGGRSYAGIVNSLLWEKLVREAGEGEGGGGSWTRTRYAKEEVLAWTAGAVRRRGWLSKRAAEERGTMSTAALVDRCLAPPPGNFIARAEWLALRAEVRPEDQDRARGAAALEWALALDASTEYEQNLRLVASQEACEPKHIGILASAISAYERHLGREIERAARAAAPKATVYIGNPGDRVDIEVAVERVAEFETQFGQMTIVTMRVADGAIVVWKTSRPGKLREVGWCGPIRATVKAHSEWRGEAQTEVARVAISDRA